MYIQKIKGILYKSNEVSLVMNTICIRHTIDYNLILDAKNRYAKLCPSRYAYYNVSYLL